MYVYEADPYVTQKGTFPMIGVKRFKDDSRPIMLLGVGKWSKLVEILGDAQAFNEVTQLIAEIKRR